MKTYLVDAAIKLFGYYLFNRKDAMRIKELEDQLHEANILITDMAYLTQEERVGQTIEHKEGVIESVHHYSRSYCKRNNLKFEEA